MDRREVRVWMLEEYDEYVDHMTDELCLTTLVEEACIAFDLFDEDDEVPQWLDDMAFGVFKELKRKGAIAG